MVITIFVQSRDGLWLYCYTGCMLSRAPRTKVTLPDFRQIMGPGKGTHGVPVNGIDQCGYRIIQCPQIFRGLTSCQRDPRVLGRHNYLTNYISSITKRNDFSK